jgi:hypothetical protein
MTRIKNIAIAAVTALGLTMAPAQVSADAEDVAKVVAGVAILGLIAKSINDRDDRQSQSVTTTQFSRVNSLDDRRGTRIIRGNIKRHSAIKGKSGKKYKRAALPQRCLRILDTSRRDRLVYPQRCLTQNYRYANRLPETCQRQVRTNRGIRNVYLARCLARDGWRVARR